jgi:hypothetical protein
MAWTTFELPKIPTPVTTAVDSLKTIASTASAALTVVKTLVQALSAVEIASLSASQIAINAAVTAVMTAIDSLTNDTGIYVLLVPPRSRVVIPDAVRAALASSIGVSPTTTGLQTQAMFDGETKTTQTANILNTLFSATGGNAGFVRSVTESFDDLGDSNRPMLSSTDAVAGMYIVAGADNISSLLPFTNGMSSLMAPGRPTALDAPSIPAPQNLRAYVVTDKNVLLKWTFQQPTVEIPTLGTFSLVTEIAVIRSTSVTLLSAATPQELFGTNQLSVGMKTGDTFTEVISVEPYTGVGFKSTYLDDSEHALGTGYYYAISFHIKLGGSLELSSGGGTDIGFPRLSNVAKVYLSQLDHGTPRSTVGVPPDWYRTPRVVDLFPAVGNLLNQISALAFQFSDTTMGYGDLLKANVKVIEQQIKSYTDLATQLTAASAAISAFSSINLGSVSSRTFAGIGGNDFIKKDIITAFGDTTDPNRPAFDGDQFVAGVVLLATTPSAVALLNDLMGSLSVAQSIIADALAKIDVALGTIETAVFNDDMSVDTAATAPTAAAAAAGTTIPDIGPAGSYCYHSYESNPTFDDTLKPRST